MSFATPISCSLYAISLGSNVTLNARRWTAPTKNSEMVFVEERSQGNCKAFHILHIAIQLMYIVHALHVTLNAAHASHSTGSSYYLEYPLYCFSYGPTKYIFPLQSDEMSKKQRRRVNGSCIRAWKVLPFHSGIHHLMRWGLISTQKHRSSMIFKKNIFKRVLDVITLLLVQYVSSQTWIWLKSAYT